MKICVVIFVLSLIKTELSAAPSTPNVVSPTVDDSSSIRGIRETVYFDNSTTFLTLNCSCTNELIQWFANGSLCRVFLNSAILPGFGSSVCDNSTPSTLTIAAPFSEIQYFCIGAGGKTGCIHRSFLKQFVASDFVFNTSLDSFTYSAHPTRHSWQPLINLAAFICIILLNFIILNKLS